MSIPGARRDREQMLRRTCRVGSVRGTLELIVAQTKRRLGPMCRDAKRTRGVVWVESRVVVEVSFTELMLGGCVIRYFLG